MYCSEKHECAFRVISTLFLLTKPGGQKQARNYFIRTLDNNRAVTILQQASEVNHLRKNPVTVLGKPVQHIPTTYEFVRNEGLASVMNLISEIRGRRISPNSNIKLTDVIANDCPISIYVHCHKQKPWHGDFRYWSDQKNQLKVYLRKRLKDLELLPV